MALLDKLKSLLGLDDGRSGSDRQGTDEAGVTVERERGATEKDAPPASPAPGSGAAKPEPAAESEPAPSTDSEPEPDVDPEVEPPAAEETVGESTDETGTEPLSGPEPDEGNEPLAQPESEPLETVDSEPGPEAGPADDAPATEAGADGGSVRDIKGIGPSYETKLSEAGIDSTTDLAAADAGELSAETGLSEKRIQGWIDRARAR